MTLKEVARYFQGRPSKADPVFGGRYTIAGNQVCFILLAKLKYTTFFPFQVNNNWIIVLLFLLLTSSLRIFIKQQHSLMSYSNGTIQWRISAKNLLSIPGVLYLCMSYMQDSSMLLAKLFMNFGQNTWLTSYHVAGWCCNSVPRRETYGLENSPKVSIGLP